MSAMRSASSMTTKLTSSSAKIAAGEQVFEAAGGGHDDVDATPEGFALRLVARTAVDGDDPALAARASSAPSSVATWRASSRVGHEHQARAAAWRRRRWRASASTRPNAMVLPEPVGARPQTSWPARASGRIAAWMGNGVLIERAGQARDEFSRHAEFGEGQGQQTPVGYSGPTRVSSGPAGERPANSRNSSDVARSV